MKSLAVVVLIALAAFASTPALSSDSSTASGSVSTPSGDDGASALPRTVGSERTTIFGLSPTAAVVMAAALLVVVILAVVAMTRSE